jgi:uncharacterized protein (DUF302 family)
MLAKIQEQRFEGARVYVSSEKSYEQLQAALLNDIGDCPVDLGMLAENYATWEAYREQVEGYEGPSGFMLFGLINHGDWMAKVGTFRRSLRVILGNPTIAITMLQHDLNAGLFAPVEVLLVEEADGTSSLMYVKPSSLMVVVSNPELLSAAQVLDEKLQALVVKVAS